MVEARYQPNSPETEVASQIKTRKLGSVNSALLSETYNEIQRPLNGPCIMLYLPNGGKPIELWNIATVTLGRIDRFSSVQPMIDLSDHHGSLLGVSRLHAEIFYRDGHYFVRDCGSTNGTWVNQHKLDSQDEIQLSDGDSLRLGHLMIQIGNC